MRTADLTHGADRAITHVYLSGPMTGIKDFNFPVFKAAAKELRRAGYEVFVPGENEEYDGIELARQEVQKHKREYFMSRDIFWITEMADAVVVLPGWEASEGAKVEVAVAQAIGLPVFRFEDLSLLTDKVLLVARTPHDC